jgi:hypothetical protein
MDIQELHDFKLGDAIKFHRKLNPKLWHDEQLDPIVRKQLLKIAEDFVEDLGVKLHVKDITISGSNAAFTYTPHSDLDLHVVVDMKKLPDSDVYRELFQAKKTLYNEANSIKVRGIPIELYVQDSDVPVRSLGEYSVLNDHWIKIPKKQKASFDQMATKEKYEQLSELVKLAMKTRDLDRIKKAIGIVHRYREAGLHNEGEFSPENLAYKAIRKQGGIDKLYDLRDKLHGQSLSIEEAASREDAIIKINKLLNTSGRTNAEIEITNNIIDKMMKQYNIKPEELDTVPYPEKAKMRADFYKGPREPVDLLKSKIAKAAYEKTQAASALKGEWERFKRGFFSEDEGLNEAYTSKQQVIDHFVKNRKYGVPSSTAARQGAAAWEKGWRGPKPKPAIASTLPTKPWLPYKDDLDESLDSEPYPYSRTNLGDIQDVYMQYSFKTEKDFPYHVIIEGSGRSKLVNVSFMLSGARGQQHRMDITGTGDARRIFSTVIDIVKKYAAENKPKTIAFTADEPSRRRLYDRFMPRVSREMPEYQASSTPSDSLINGRYRLERKPKQVDEASGYIPSNKQRNDPRYSTALTVDVNPDANKKNAAAFGWKVSRAGIPPQARPDGKIAESLINEGMTFNPVVEKEARDGEKYWTGEDWERKVTMNCRDCDGTGKDRDHTCPYCRGTGKEEDTVSDAPELQVSNANGEEIQRMLGLDPDYSGVIYNKDLPDIMRRLIMLKNKGSQQHTQDASVDKGAMRRQSDDQGVAHIGRGATMYDAGRSQSQVDRYIDQLIKLVQFAQKNNTSLGWG